MFRKGKKVSVDPAVFFDFAYADTERYINEPIKGVVVRTCYSSSTYLIKLETRIENKILKGASEDCSFDMIWVDEQWLS